MSLDRILVAGVKNKDALYGWESLGDPSLNARGQTTSVDFPFFNGHAICEECMFCVTHSTNAQENGLKSYDSCTNEYAEVCIPPRCRPAAVPPTVVQASRPHSICFNQVHMGLIAVWNAAARF
eukprot:1143386-Pelagomonas_calceolata.AAC.1